ncbi:Nucleoside 5-triphosphatase RdgB (dHAPTP, dITP, XTP-specific) [Alkalibacterium sp. AK22]|uniref:XTP/dITP diphosphatase n=1 Tax=Alkalibacterium sp. AK22 TaxID=1229520 RepID=UPI00044864A5|nr:Nucleoside 5-triphosphatase RdgB (dHAPTP, dITP, XTP-specific) [Alkalibacterium sp. AK22]
MSNNTSKHTLLVATRNEGKAREFEYLFNQKGFQVKTLLDYPELPDVEETGESFDENAVLKAETIAQHFKMFVLADDSGLMVDALHGQPGIYSARYAGEEKNDAKNNAKLLNELYDISDADRTAKFHCSLALAKPGRKTLVVEGQVEGRIAGVPQGENGFGYDSLFFLPERDCTMAQLSKEEKNQLSHRAKAIQELGHVLDHWLNTDEEGS